MLPIQPYTFKPSRWVALVLPALVLAYLMVIKDQQKITRKEYATIVIGVISAGVSLIYFARRKIEIDNEGITDIKMFGKTFIAWQEIVASDIVVEAEGHGIRPKWVIERNNATPYKMDLPFGRRNFKIMAEAFTMRASHAQLSNKIIKLSNGEKVSFFID